MKQILRLSTCCIFVFFGFNVSAQTSTDLKNSSVKLKHIKNNNLILITPTSVVKNEAEDIEYPEKPKKEEPKKKDALPKPPKQKQAIIDEKNNPK